ncbi:signal transduction histidine kinase [Tamaricihabitans halophyticus]|uniref:histidine kinase n=1 Tax=Tamaricihabitans halophyticus TaxID=1262583 RepID=A0A4R2QA06_9PSEU|nr:ATP-binding protein [Tamaricihabitans halophyticus]TCP45419.1 signal transduction histidine kinase [Tamaricihabitans halophyticus]
MATAARLRRDPGKLGGSRVPARLQIVGWFVLVMAVGLISVVLLLRHSLVSEIEERANRALEQDAEEFRSFAAAGHDPTTGQQINDPQLLMQQHLRSQYTDSAELLLAVTRTRDGLDIQEQGNESVRRVPLGQQRLRPVVEGAANSGTLETARGEMRWIKVNVLPANSAAQEPQAWFVAGYFLDAAQESAESTVRTLLIASGFALLLGAGVSWVVAGQILAPVRTVRQAAAALTEHDLTHRIPVQGRDDIAALAQQFNAMLDRLESAFRNRQQFLDDAGHELRTPITIVRGHLEVMGFSSAGSPDSAEAAERAEVIRLCTDELDRMARIVEDLLLLAKAEQPDFVTPVDTSVPELTSDIDAKVRAIAPRKWTLERIGEGNAWLDPQRVTQAVLQLAQNAVQHTSDGDEIRIGSTIYRGVVSFWVTDTGPGVRQEDAERIFQRFARAPGSARQSEGAGLGLSIVKAIVDAHHGRVRLVSQPGNGATFGMELPARPDIELGG